MADTRRFTAWSLGLLAVLLGLVTIWDMQRPFAATLKRMMTTNHLGTKDAAPVNGTAAQPESRWKRETRLDQIDRSE